MRQMHVVSIQIVGVNCIRWTCLSVWSTLYWSHMGLPKERFHKGFKETLWHRSQTKLVGKPCRTIEVPVLRLLNRSKNDNNKNCFCNIWKANLSVITRDIKIMPTQVIKYNSIKKSIRVTAKIVIFPVFWWPRSQKNKTYILTEIFYIFTE